MSVIHQARKVSADIFFAILLLALYFSGLHTTLPAPVQLVTLKMTYVSLGFLHAHVLGNLAFPVVRWDGQWSPIKILRISLYVVVIYAWSLGG